MLDDVQRARRNRKVVIAIMLALAVWGWFDVRVRGTVDPNNPEVHKTDFTVYTEAGAAFFDGRDPYTVSNPRGWRYLYPPLFAILVSPLHALDPQAQVLVWFALSVLMGWGCYLEWVRIACRLLPNDRGTGAFGPIPFWLGIAALTAAALPALNCLQRGQVGIAKLYLLLLGFRLLFENRSLARSVAGGAILALAVALKITPLVPVAFLMCQQLASAWYTKGSPRRWIPSSAGPLGTIAGLALWFVFLPAALVGWRANLHHLNTWWHSVATDPVISDNFAGTMSLRNQSFTIAAHHLGNWAHYHFAGGSDDRGAEQLCLGGRGLPMDEAWMEMPLLVVRLVAVGLLVAVGYRTARSQDKLGQAAVFGLACVLTLIVFAIARAHYYVLLLPAVTFVCLWLLRRDQWNWAVGLAIVPGILVVGHYAFLSVTGRIGLLGLGTTLWYVSASVRMLMADRSASGNASAPLRVENVTRAPTRQPVAA